MKLKHIGAGVDDGRSLIDEIEDRLVDLAMLASSEANDNKAKLDISIQLESKNEGNDIVIACAVKETRPGRRRRSVTSHFNNDGQLVVMNAEQITLPFTRKPRLESAPEAQPEE